MAVVMAFNGRGWYVITPAGPAGPYKSKSDAMSSAAALRYVVRYLSATDVDAAGYVVNK